MQIFARAAEGHTVSARNVPGEIDYFCLECGGKVRARAGKHRQRHFYHYHRRSPCRQNHKTLLHLRTQEKIHSLLPSGEAHLEHPFPTIGRVADLFWTTHNLVFEIQCSPITAHEVAQRNRDYSSLGLTVVWILHDRRFNRRRVTAAEHFLWDKLHYYTNIDSFGRGAIYDQLRLYRQGLVLHRLPRRRVALQYPIATLDPDLPQPEQIIARAAHYPFCFKGDALTDPIYCRKLLEIKVAKKRKIPPFWRLVTRPYIILFRLLLERTCTGGG